MLLRIAGTGETVRMVTNLKAVVEYGAFRA
jgi:hypothetical protein